MPTTETPFTREEARMAERVGQILAPAVRAVLDRHRAETTTSISKFCSNFAATRAALDALSDHAAPMARVELELRLIELAQKFVDEHSAKA